MLASTLPRNWQPKFRAGSQAPLARLALCTLTLLLSANSYSANNISANNNSAHNELTLEPCQVQGSNGQVAADCGRLQRPLNFEDPDGAQISLFVAVIRSLAPNPAADAVTVVNGGPGASSTELYADLAGVFGGLLRDRDIVVIDQRGTGQSTPLECPELEAATSSSVDPSQEQMRDELQGFTKQCLAALPADPRFFTTSAAVRDLEAVREALGYDQLNLYGVSYGTRVVQHYARRYPAQTRALIIDGVLPPGLAMGPMVSSNAQLVLDNIFTRCAAEPACQQAFPNLSADFKTLATQLRAAPVTLQVNDPVTGVPVDLDLGYGHLATSIRIMAYAPETVSLIPVLIDQAANHNNYLPIATQALQIQQQLNASMSYGMHNAVVCTEDVPFLSDSERLGSGVIETYLGAEQVQSLVAMCDVWPAGLLDEDLREPLSSDIPTLVLSGEQDPITPPRYGTQVAEGLSRSHHVIAPGQGHGVISRGCIPRLLMEFLEELDTTTLDTQCTQRLGPEPFFVDLMGPSRQSTQASTLQSPQPKKPQLRNPQLRNKELTND